MSEKAIEGLKPELVWQRFFEISQIPRPSKSEEKLLTYLKKLAERENLSFKQDEAGNITISVPATKGYENNPVIILQGHIDMVCEKNKGTDHDFDNDPLKLVYKDGWIKTDGTTLGADNGIGVAASLALINDRDAVHGPLELLLTVDEETGLNGATNMDGSIISGKTLLNLDSEEDGTFYVGCSGGFGTSGNWKISYQSIPAGFVPYNLEISGLKGGHSGLEIQTGKANSLKLMARILYSLPFEFYISKIEGGNKRNAIPREAEAVIFLKSSDIINFSEFLKSQEEEFRSEFKTADGNVKISCEPSEDKTEKVFDKQFTAKIIQTLIALPHGVINFSQDLPGLVETSTNLAIIKISEDVLSVITTQRSSVESAKYYIAASVKSIFELGGGEVVTGDDYPGWKPNLDSKVLKTSKEVYKRLFNSEPVITAIHAGLECGILGDKSPGMDMISFGPTITGVHSPDEQVNVAAVEKFYFLLKEILKEYAKNYAA